MNLVHCEGGRRAVVILLLVVVEFRYLNLAKCGCNMIE